MEQSLKPYNSLYLFVPEETSSSMRDYKYYLRFEVLRSFNVKEVLMLSFFFNKVTQKCLHTVLNNGTGKGE